jgi:hypothetical protein
MANDFVNPLNASNFHYIKLHGSYGWKRSNLSDCLVIGYNKENQIVDEPLLSYYFELFQKSLNASNVQLMIIGYGFGDRHINRVLADAHKKSGLRIYVISPNEQSEFIRCVRSTDEYGADILHSIAGYFPYTLLDIFPKDQSESHAYREIRRSFFEN